MTFGSKSVVRNALKVDGKWYVGKGPLVDGSSVNRENDFQFEEIKDDQGNVTAVKISLDTLDGLKFIVIKLV